MEACDFRNEWESFNTLNAIILGISPDSIKTHQSFITKESLNFTLLSDSQKSVLKSYGAWGLKSFMEKNMKRVIRSTFLIDPKGKIAYIWKNVKVKGHIAEVLAKLKELQETQG